ncbi:hypothetical protein V6Z11_A09G066400 [Gossypium hirsutum]
MVRLTGKQQHTPGMTRFLLICIVIGLLLTCLIADIFWASSSRFKLLSLLILNNWSLHSFDFPATIPFQFNDPLNSSANQKPKVKKKLFLLFRWWKKPKMVPAPVPRLYGAAIQIKNPQLNGQVP